jgi:alpha/beta superfamily hydrolase
VPEIFFSRESRMTITGPCGNLEVLVNGVASSSNVKGFAVICHPHPLHWGTMDNKVVVTLARAFREMDVIAVRFNFRGVGKSDGQHAGGEGEKDDLQAVIDWMRGQFPDIPCLVAGFSFGGAVAAAWAGDNSPRYLVLVAPAIGRYGASITARLSCPALVILGEEDEILGVDDISHWQQHQDKHTFCLEVLPGTGHFFHGRLNDLKALVIQRLEKVVKHD